MEKDRAQFKVEFKKRLYKFVLDTVAYIDALPRGMVSEVTGKQLLRSVTSILANYIEGQSASSKKDFINFFNYSLKSANESKVWFAIIRDTRRASKEKTDPLLQELEEISKILASSIITLRKKK